MNFIGHAAVALWSGSDPLFVLGSMLPDFEGMARTRLAAAAALPPALSDGIALHHRTDAAFHGAPLFTSLASETSRVLAARGLSRGQARAVGHVGVEMLLDGELLCEGSVPDAYVDALRSGSRLDASFFDAQGGARWELLRRRLLAAGPPHDYRDPARVLARLDRTLSGRPRLALDAAALRAVEGILPGVQAAVRTQHVALLAEVRKRLDVAPPSVQ